MVILANESNGNKEDEDEEDGNEESLAEASLPLEIAINEVRSDKLPRNLVGSHELYLTQHILQERKQRLLYFNTIS